MNVSGRALFVRSKQAVVRKTQEEKFTFILVTRAEDDTRNGKLSFKLVQAEFVRELVPLDDSKKAKPSLYHYRH